MAVNTFCSRAHLFTSSLNFGIKVSEHRAEGPGLGGLEGQIPAKRPAAAAAAVGGPDHLGRSAPARAHLPTPDTSAAGTVGAEVLGTAAPSQRLSSATLGRQLLLLLLLPLLRLNGLSSLEQSCEGSEELQFWRRSAAKWSPCQTK